MKHLSKMLVSGLIGLGTMNNTTQAQTTLRDQAQQETVTLLDMQKHHTHHKTIHISDIKNTDLRIPAGKSIGLDKNLGYTGNLVDEHGICMLDMPREELAPIIQQHIEHILGTIDMGVEGTSVYNTTLGDLSIRKESKDKDDYDDYTYILDDYTYILTINGHRYAIQTAIKLNALSKRRNSQKQQAELVFDLTIVGEKVFTIPEVAAKITEVFLNIQERYKNNKTCSNTIPIYEKAFITLASFKYQD